MANKKDPLTLSDISHVAGVSTATVSRVLNGKGFVSEDMRKRVQQVINELGFQPQRSHKKSDSNIEVAIFTGSLINSFFAQILSAIQEQSADRGMLPFVIQMPENEERRVAVFKQLKQHPWAGFISAGFYMTPEEWVQLHEETQAPIVILNTLVEHPCIVTLQVNFEGATVKAIQHLLNLGHTRIAYLGDFSNEFSGAEFRGVEAALVQHGYTYPEEYRFSVPHTPEGASQGIYSMMMLPKVSRPTALLTFDDEFAIHTLNALRYYGLHVPEDISIVGFDNIPMAAHTFPSLTTIDVPKYRIGQQMVVLLQQLIDNNGSGTVGHVVIDGSLVVRDSSGPAPRVST